METQNVSNQEEPDIDELVSTLETLGVTPRFVLQHNSISRSIHNLSATAKKLAAMALSLLPADLSSRTAAFTFTEFHSALGIPVGGESFKLFKNAATECMKNIIHIETNKIIKGKRQWEQLTWFSHSSFNEATGMCTMTFSQELCFLLLEMKKVYAKINLQDIGKLQSKYAIRIFEIATSYSSLAGKDGNKAGIWYFERELPELRDMLGVPSTAYFETRDFRKFAVEQPI
jgi:plasmid replication initiation protein